MNQRRKRPSPGEGGGKASLAEGHHFLNGKNIKRVSVCRKEASQLLRLKRGHLKRGKALIQLDDEASEGEKVG